MFNLLPEVINLNIHGLTKRTTKGFEMKKKVKVENVTTHIRELDYTEARGHHVCPLCRKKINPGKTYLLINNYKLFPNVIIHEWCVDRIIIMNGSPEKDWESTIMKLKNDFERAEKARKDIACWFR